MFKFKNKTIEEFRDEVARFIGNEITFQNGEKRILDEVTKNDVHYLSTLSGNFKFMPHNGEVDLGKAIKGVKMFGFVVTLSETDLNGCKRTTTEKILVPFDDSRDDKQFVLTSNEGSILSC